MPFLSLVPKAEKETVQPAQALLILFLPVAPYFCPGESDYDSIPAGSDLLSLARPLSKCGVQFKEERERERKEGEHSER